MISIRLFLLRLGYSELSILNHNGKDVNSDCLADQWDEREASLYMAMYIGKMKNDDPEIVTAPTPKF